MVHRFPFPPSDDWMTHHKTREERKFKRGEGHDDPVGPLPPVQVIPEGVSGIVEVPGESKAERRSRYMKEYWANRKAKKEKQQ
jgi:hypothetical protein